MAIDTSLNQDRRAKDEGVHVARGVKSRTVEAIIAAAGTTKSTDFEANGKFIGMLVEVPNLGTGTLTVEIFPQDATNAEAIIFSKAGLTENLVHYVDIQENTTNNVTKWLFGHHTLKVTASGAIGGVAQTVKVVPIIGRH